METAPPGFVVKRGSRGKGAADLERAGSVSSAAAVPDAADDAPQGFDRPLSFTASVACFHRKCDWFYVDPSGEEHGPVPLQKILNWHRKGHFPDDVKVRCRSPWYGVGALLKAFEDTPDADTPTAAGCLRSGSGFGAELAGSSFAAAVVPPALAPPPPPPPPPRPAASGAANEATCSAASSAIALASGSSGLASGAGDAELRALFVGDAARGGEPVWFYLDRSDQVQGPFRAAEMIGWVGSGMLKSDTRMCGAEPKLGIPPGRSLFQPLAELQALVLRGECYRPASLDVLRRKSSTPGSAVVGGLAAGQPPPPPPPPRRADSAGDGFAGGFGPPGRASEALTWRKDLVTPAAEGDAAASTARGPSTADGAEPGSSASASNAPGAGAGSWQPAPGSESPPAAPSNDGGGGGASLAHYHSSNAAALGSALAPEQDFEYGDDFKRQRAAAHMSHGSLGRGVREAVAGQGRANSLDERDGGDSRGAAASGNERQRQQVLQQAQLQELLLAQQEQQRHMLQQAMQQQQQAMQQQQQAMQRQQAMQQQQQQQQAMQQQQQQQQALQQQQQQQQQHASQAAIDAAGLRVMGPSAASASLLHAGLAPPASAPGAMPAAVGGAGPLQGLPAGFTASLLNMQLQQPGGARLLPAVPSSGAMPALVSMPFTVQPLQQQQVANMTPQLQMLIQGGQLQPQQLAAVLGCNNYQLQQLPVQHLQALQLHQQQSQQQHPPAG